MAETTLVYSERDHLMHGIAALLTEAEATVVVWDSAGVVPSPIRAIAFEKTIELLLQARPLAEWVADAGVVRD